MNANYYLIAYDIKDDKNRAKALRILRKVSVSYQDSVFDIRVKKAKLTELQSQLYPLISDGDFLFTLKLQSEISWQLGTGLIPISRDFVVLS